MFLEGDGALIAAAKPLLKEKFRISKFRTVDPNITGLNWRPTLWTESSDGVLYFVEASPDVFHPAIVHMNYAALVQAGRPIHVITICTDISFRNTNARDRSLRKREGFGLVIVDSEGLPTLEVRGKPIVQVISEEEMKQHLGSPRKALRDTIHHSYERYVDDSLAGLREVSEVVEGMCVRLHDDVRGTRSTGYTPLASLIEGMIADSAFSKAKSELNGARHYVTMVRNSVSHHPKTRSDKIRRIMDVKTNFINGIRRCNELSDAARKLGCSGLTVA